MEMFIVRSFFGGELIGVTVTPAVSLEAAKKNFMAWCDPRCEAVTVEPCSLGRSSYDGSFWAVQEGYAVAYSKDLLQWQVVDDVYDGNGLEWSTVLDEPIC